MSLLKSKKLLLVLLLILLGGGVFANTPAWRIMTADGTTRFGFFYGSETVAVGDEKVSLNSDGRLGIGTLIPEASAILEIKSANKGFLVPRTNLSIDSQKPSPLEGMLVYDTDPNRNCFRFYQKNPAAWSECLGVGAGLKLEPSVTGLAVKPRGTVIYVQDTDTVYVSNGTAWISLSGNIVPFGSVTPTSGTPGDLFFNTTTKRISVFHGTGFTEVNQDLLRFSPVSENCVTVSASSSRLNLTCPASAHISGLGFEAGIGTNLVDTLQAPEVESIRCCETSFNLTTP